MNTVDDTDVLAHVLGPALHSLRAAIPHELAVLYELCAGRLRARSATGPLASPTVGQHVLDVTSSPGVQQALDAGHPAVLTGVDLYAGVLEPSPELACLVVPLRHGDECLGMLVLVGTDAHAQANDALGLAGWGQGLASTLALSRRVESPLGGRGRILPLREAVRRHLTAALEHTAGKIYGRDGAASLLDLKPTTLQSKLKKHGINRLEVVAGAAGGEAGGATGGATGGERSSQSARAPSSELPSKPRAHAGSQAQDGMQALPAE